MKILLVQPVYSINYSEQNLINFPLGIISLATAIRRQGFDVKVRDLQREAMAGELIINDEYIHKTAVEMINCGYNLIGFSCMSVSYLLVIKLCNELKRLNSSIITMVGGPHPTLVPRETILKIKCIDYVMIGEAENSIIEFLQCLHNNLLPTEVAGICFQSKGQVIYNEPGEFIKNLDDIALFDYDVMENSEVYFGENKQQIRFPIEAGRGCPYHCTFCSTSIVWRRNYRVKSTDRIVYEVNYYKQKYGCTMFSFLHDNLAANRKYLLELCAAMKDKCKDVNWTISSRTDNVDRELMYELSQAGCVGIYFGIETGSERTQKRIRKNLKLDNVYDTLQWCNEFGISATYSFIIGYPFESLDDIEDTLYMMVKLRYLGSINTQIHFLIPEATTPLTSEYYDNLELNNLMQIVSGNIIPNIETDFAFINESKEIFTSFYSFTGCIIKACDYAKICIVMHRLTFLMPKSLYLLHYIGKIKIYDIVMSIAAQANCLEELKDEYIMEAFIKYMNDFCLKEKDALLLKHYFEYESIRYQAKTKGSKSKNRLLVRNAFTHTFQFDIRYTLNYDIKLYQSYKPLNQPCHTLIIYGSHDLNIKTFVGISLLKKLIVDMIIKGYESKEEIIDCLSAKYMKIQPELLSGNIMKTIQELQEANILAITI